MKNLILYVQLLEYYFLWTSDQFSFISEKGKWIRIYQKIWEMTQIKIEAYSSPEQHLSILIVKTLSEDEHMFKLW